MAGQIFFNGPEPAFTYDKVGNQQPVPLGYCTLCAMIYKGAATSQLEHQVKSALGREGIVTTLDMPPATKETPLHPAVAWGLVPNWAHPQFGTQGNGLMPFPVPLCWTHMMGANATGSVLQAGTAAEGNVIKETGSKVADLSQAAARQRGGGR